MMRVCGLGCRRPTREPPSASFAPAVDALGFPSIRANRNDSQGGFTMKIQKASIIALAAAGVLCAGLSLAQEQISQTYPILGGSKEHQPTYGEIENFTILGYSDLNGWDRPTEIRVDAAGKYAYMASNPPPVDGKNAGGTIADVS